MDRIPDFRMDVQQVLLLGRKCGNDRIEGVCVYVRGWLCGLCGLCGCVSR